MCHAISSSQLVYLVCLDNINKVSLTLILAAACENSNSQELVSRVHFRKKSIKRWRLEGSMSCYELQHKISNKQCSLCRRFTCHLEFLKQRKIRKRNKLPRSTWARCRRDEAGRGRRKKNASIHPTRQLNSLLLHIIIWR